MGEIEHDIRLLVPSIWETLFARPVDESAATEIGESPLISSYVAIDGTWKGGLLVEMPLTLAARLTAEMLQSEVQPSSEEISDAMGEFCNILAGNFKALVPAPSHLALPVVTLGSDYALSVVGTHAETTVPYRDGSHVFLVTVHEGGEPE